MPEKKREPEMEALQAVHAALKPLRPEERSKVLASVFALLGMQPSEVPFQPAPSSPPGSSSIAAPPRARPTESTLRPQGSRPVSIVELMKEKGPGTNAQRITLFAYYRDKHEGLTRFGRNDLQAYFSKAKEQPPRNFDRDFVEAVKKGWLHEDGGDSYITSKGIEAVEAAFAGERKYARTAKVGRRPRRGAKATTRKKKLSGKASR